MCFFNSRMTGPLGKRLLLCAQETKDPDNLLRHNDANDRENRRNRTNTAHIYADKYSAVEQEPPVVEMRPSIRSTRTASTAILSESHRRETELPDFDCQRPGINRSTTFQGPTQLRDMSPLGGGRISRVPSENINMRVQRSQLRPLHRAASGLDVFGDSFDEPNYKNEDSLDRTLEIGSQRSASPATSLGSAPSRTTSYSALSSSFPNSKKQAPPPPPSRAKKPPPPPPPPMKRSTLSTNNVSYA